MREAWDVDATSKDGSKMSDQEGGFDSSRGELNRRVKKAPGEASARVGPQRLLGFEIHLGGRQLTQIPHPATEKGKGEKVRPKRTVPAE